MSTALFLFDMVTVLALLCVAFFTGASGRRYGDSLLVAASVAAGVGAASHLTRVMLASQ